MMTPSSAGRKLAAMLGTLRKCPDDLRFVLPWLRSHRRGYSPLTDEIPWVTYKAISWLEGYLTPSMTVFEYGAGGSTVFLAKRAKRVVSVEHDEGYYRYLSRRMASLGNCELMLRIPGAWSDANDEFVSYQDKYRGVSFEDYVKSIDQYPDSSFDLVIIDGRARMACIRRAMCKVKPDGYLMLDNAERPGYAEAERILAAFPRTDMPGLAPWNLDVCRTTVWRLAEDCRQ